MFAEDGPRPRATLEAVIRQEGQTGRTPDPEDLRLREAMSRKDAAVRLERLVTLMRLYRELGRSASPDVLAEWLAIAGDKQAK
jgi:hypothetical protein